MPGKDEKPQEAKSVEEPVDFDNSESRMTFLKGQLNDMLDGINSIYGQDLMDELLKRLEKTVEDFNGEVSGLIGKLTAGKIFEEDTPEESSEKSDSSEDEVLEGDEDPEKSFEDQEEEDQDIIARMRKRITHD
ncbi:MAG: hypothetical protein HN995_11765 [Candidatus Marinimicrobia bacterium]|mgnify:CR=1 FL=1|jgi:hypothetical protein|nr:hypothetical protein [Candidatus Neomarinimicrobiota bacterium]MBT3575092.1 hypothetical protein [Candidatus Neomarinimicrobiota bacterium]MBT3678864.1 hypothetical protein [Candidatus Neomarinimicrobiota bacterium]MBT3949978.1 hypothetical protein [Candidatus Neomarinimicrobiota bacterium]MBT4252681.1 hypothetical protein [Candidatus Neomarinimicrobiota bacterium]